MVSKAAVIAIVGILAVPIFLGYAMNLEETTETDYRSVGDPINITPLLQSGIGYTYVNGNTSELNTFNTSFNSTYLNASGSSWPVYESFTGKKTSLFLQHDYSKISTPGSYSTSLNIYLPNFYYCGQTLIGVASSPGYLTLKLTLNDGQADSQAVTIPHILSWIYIDTEKTVYYQYYDGANILSGTYTNSNIRCTGYTKTGTWTGSYIDCWYVKNTFPNTSNWVDISGGYHFVGDDNWVIGLPSHTKNAILTIDLDSITDSNYSILIGAGGNSSSPTTTDPYYLTKTTTDGVVSWTLTSYSDPSKTWDLYYDPSIPHNTYQIYWDWTYDYSSDPYYYWPLDMDFKDDYYNSHREFRYVGNWPTFIGESNVYWKVTDDVVNVLSLPASIPEEYQPVDLDYNFDRFYLSDVTSESQERSPTVRVDSALYRGLEYPLIQNRTYDPATFKTNPATTINDPVVYGSSFTFGGNTYTVSKGNIRLESHDIPVKGLVLSSVPKPEGGYDNKIGNTVISSSLYPSTITFNGNWSASITTIAQEEYEITKTEWKAGDFAWDGIDHNFIMAGLIASIGAFVGVGIYARRVKTSLWPLLLVCGGAALLFFVML